MTEKLKQDITIVGQYYKPFSYIFDTEPHKCPYHGQQKSYKRTQKIHFFINCPIVHNCFFAHTPCRKCRRTGSFCDSRSCQTWSRHFPANPSQSACLKQEKKTLCIVYTPYYWLKLHKADGRKATAVGKKNIYRLELGRWMSCFLLQGRCLL